MTLVTAVTMVKVVTAVTVVTEVTVVSSKKNHTKFPEKKNATSQKNIASIANSCPEHIPWLSMCQFVVTEKCHNHLVTKKI